MIYRVSQIGLSLIAGICLYWGYHELGILRRTVFWEYRFLIFGCSAFLLLSLLEAGLGWLSAKLGAR